MRRLLIAGCLGAAVVAAAGSAHAHAIQTNLEAFGNNHVLLLQSSFGDGLPADAAKVTLVPPSGQPIPVGTTNSKGELSFALPGDANGEWEVQVDGGPGHRDYLNLPIHKGQADLNRVSDRPRRNPLEGLAEGKGATPWILIGAIGSIMGGCTTVLLGRQRSRRPKS
jgi:nickel transport protein